MYFPFKYTGEVLINKTDDFSFERYMEQLNSAVKTTINPITQKQELTYPLPWINLVLRYSFNIDYDHSVIQAKFVVKLFELNVFFILSAGLSVFLFYAQIFSFASLFLIIAFVYYWFALSKVSHGIKTILLQNKEQLYPMQEPGLWKKQQHWMNDKSVCPACGEPKNPYSVRCINCGIVVNKSIKKENKNISATNSLDTIDYHLKKDKNEKNRR